MKLSVVSLLALALLVVTGLGVMASPHDITVSCDVDTRTGFCTSGKNITIRGKDLDDLNLVHIGSTLDSQSRIKCELDKSDHTENRTCALDMDYFPGVYAFTGYALEADGSLDHIYPMGSLALGELKDFDLGNFSKAWNSASPPEYDVVTGYSDASLRSFETWTIYGNFTLGHEYRVFFYSSDGLGMPTCGQDKAIVPYAAMSKNGSNYANAIDCVVRSKPSIMGMFTLLVQDATTGGFVRGTTGLAMVSVQPSLPNVTGATGACAKNSVDCVNHASITFTGIRFNERKNEYNRITLRNSVEDTASSGINCTVTGVTNTSLTCALSIGPASTVVQGSFAVYAEVQLCLSGMWSEDKYLGQLMYGNFGSLTVPGFTATEVDLVRGGFVVQGASQGDIHTGGWLAVFGVFHRGHEYQLDFYNVQRAGTGVPTCSNYKVSPSMINCTGVTQKLGNLGMYRVLVKDTTAGLYVPSVTTGLDPILVFAPLPTVTGASGACASESSGCKSGATLALTGMNFVVGKTNEVLFDEKGLSCAVSAVTSSGALSCTLTVSANVSAGAYPMYVRSQACTMGMMTPKQAAGYILIGQGAQSKGWSLGPMFTSSSAGGDGDKKSGSNNSAAVVFAVIFGIITLGFIITSIVLCCCCTLTRKRKASVNYDPDAMSDRYWNADRAMEMNEQTANTGAPPAAFGTTAGAVGAGLKVPVGAAMGGAVAGKAPPPMPDDRTTIPDDRYTEFATRA